jgi:Zn-dependent protease
MPSTDSQMNGAFFAFSLPFGKATGVPTRLSWTLLLWMVLDTAQVLRAREPLLVPWALLTPLALVWMRAGARVALVRWLRGSVDDCLLWFGGDRTNLTLPLRAGSHFLVGIVGIAISLALCAGLYGLGYVVPDGYWAKAGAYVFNQSAMILLLNLLPCPGFDGARALRALLWPVLGLGRAVRTTIIASYISAGLLTAAGLYFANFLFVVFGLSLILATVYEDRLVRSGWDPVLGTDPDTMASARNRVTWWATWKARRAERRRERDQAAEEQEQKTLDELLAKVSANGLPSLTNRERRTLQDISKRQKARLGEA